MSSWIKRHSLVAYFIVAYVISWTCELPLVAVKQGWVQWPIPFSLHYLAAFGPMLAALCVTAICQGRDGLRAEQKGGPSYDQAPDIDRAFSVLAAEFVPLVRR